MTPLNFEKLLKQIFPSKKVRREVQRRLGYALVKRSHADTLQSKGKVNAW